MGSRAAEERQKQRASFSERQQRSAYYEVWDGGCGGRKLRQKLPRKVIDDVPVLFGRAAVNLTPGERLARSRLARDEQVKRQTRNAQNVFAQLSGACADA